MRAVGMGDFPPRPFLFIFPFYDRMEACAPGKQFFRGLQRKEPS